MCFSIISLMVGKNPETFYYYICQFCKWNTVSCGIEAPSIHPLLAKFTYYKGKYMKTPQQEIYKRLISLFEFNIK